MFGSDRFICPYCYEKHSQKDCIYTCSYHIVGSNKECKYDFPKNPDKTIPLKYISKCMKCDNAKLTRLCPSTNRNGKMLEIPDRACSNNFSIALVGAKQSGKSNYIAVLINEIKKKMSRNMDCSLIFCNQETNTAYQNTYYKPLYENSVPVIGTDINADAPPLIYSIDFFDKKTYKIKDSVTLSLYDTAGENFNTEAQMLSKTQYIANASGIIVLLDPLQIPSIRAQLQGKIDLPDKNNDTFDILNYVINLIRQVKKIKGNQSINIPIALTFTKMDVLAKYDILPEDGFLRVESEHIARGAWVKSDFENTQQEMDTLLQNFLVDDIEVLLRTFTQRACFGVSSFGEHPVNGMLSGEPNPNRVLDPLLWMLSLKKYIRII